MTVVELAHAHMQLSCTPACVGASHSRLKLSFAQAHGLPAKTSFLFERSTQTSHWRGMCKPAMCVLLPKPSCCLTICIAGDGHRIILLRRCFPCNFPRLSSVTQPMLPTKHVLVHIRAFENM